MFQEERKDMDTLNEEAGHEMDSVYTPGNEDDTGPDSNGFMAENPPSGVEDEKHGDGFAEDSGEGSWPPDGHAPEYQEDETKDNGDDGQEDGEAGDAGGQAEESPPAEDPPPKPTRKRTTRRKKEEPAPEGDEPGEQEEPTPPAPNTHRAASDAKDAVDVEEMSLAKRKREAALQRQRWRREREKSAILDVDGTSLVDDSDGFDEKSAAVYQAKNTRMICCGPITGVKFSRGAGHYVEAEYNGFRVLIPFSEMDITLERQRGDSDNDYDNKTITAIRNMVGAEIEFIILDIDENEQLASASRRMATEYRRREVLNGTNRDGEFYIYPGRKVVARVLDVHPFYAWVEVAGWRTRLSASELRAEYVEDMTTELANGQRITVTITELERDRSGNVVDMRISMRDDEKEKRDLEKAIAGINIGDIIRCEVVGRSSKVIRLKTHNGARAFCYIAKGLHGRYIPKLDESVTIKVIRKTTNPVPGTRCCRAISCAARSSPVCCKG